MTGIVLTMASAGVMCVAGVGVSTLLNWFHSYEIDTSKGASRDVSVNHPHADRLESLNRKLNKNK